MAANLLLQTTKEELSKDFTSDLRDFSLEELEKILKERRQAEKKKNHLYRPDTQGKTNQKVMTPPEFLMPARRVFTSGRGFSYDFASSQPNVCDIWFGEDVDSLTLDWHALFDEDTEPGWLNPPFKHSDKFLAKCSLEAALGAKVISLVQCAAGCSYWHEDNLVWGNPYCRIIFLEGRINFDGYGNGAKTDCVIIDWSPEHVHLLPHERVLIWDWRKEGSVPVLAWGANG